MVRIIQFSDTHLRIGQWRHQRAFSRAVRRAGPSDAIVITGDLSVDGADHLSDLEAAAGRFRRLTPPVYALPGNHDIGEEPASPRQRQPITPARRDRYLGVFGADHFKMALPGWVLIGLNVHLFDTNWPEEQAQWDLLETVCAQTDDVRIGLYLHKPLFLNAPDEPENALSCVSAKGRDRILALAAGGKIAFISSGHLHQSRSLKLDGVTHIWAPATANRANTRRAADVMMETGAVLWDFEPGHFRARFITT